LNEHLDTVAAKSRLYTLLAHALNYPDMDLVSSLLEGRFRRDLIAVLPLEARAILEGLSVYSGGEREKALLDLERDYTWMFFASKPRIAYLFGSVYSENKLYQDSTLEIARLYHEAGLKVEEAFKLPPDHIAVELEFMAYLVFNEMEAIKTANGEGEEYALELQQKALDKYVSPLARNIGERIANRAKTDFYRTIGHILMAIF
jgi:TorA maturation chaperone TorD